MKPAVRHAVQLVLGPAVWLLWLAVAYGAISLACALSPSAQQAGASSWINGILLLFTGGTAALLAWAAARSGRAARAGEEGARFLAWTAAFLHATAAVSTVAVGVPLLLLPPCV